MSLDPQKVAECRAWIGRACADLDSAAIVLAWNRPRSDMAPFRCQQTVEKAPSFAREVYDPILARLSKEVQP